MNEHGKKKKKTVCFCNEINKENPYNKEKKDEKKEKYVKKKKSK